MKFKLNTVCFLFRKQFLMTIMRAFLFLFCIVVLPNNMVSQDSKIKIEEDKTITVDEVFILIMNQTDYKFFYEKGIFKNSPKIHLKKGTIKTNELLKQSLSQGDLDITITDSNSILIKEKAEIILEEKQQRYEVSGTITDTSGQPLPGANILEKGTNNGAQTDFDGNFSIDVEDANSTLVISYLGYTTQEVQLNNRTSLNVVLVAQDNIMDEVILTGTGKSAVTLLETAYGASVMTAKAIERESAGMGVIDMLKGVPGLYGQPSGGEVGSSLSPRGLSSDFFSFISLQEDGLPVQFTGVYNEMQVRNDLTFDRVEVVRGGPSGVLAANGSGAIINFISRMPETEPSGKARMSITDYGAKKIEAVYGGLIAENWVATIGGYYRVGDGVKSSQFNTQRGGQLRASIKRKFNNGFLQFSYKMIDDKTGFYSGEPFKLDADGTIGTIPGFDAQKETLKGYETQYATIEDNYGWSRYKGGPIAYDLSDGIHTKSQQVSMKFEKGFGEHFKISNHARISSLSHQQSDLRNAGTNSAIQSVSDHLDEHGADYLAALPGATSIELRTADGTVLTDNSNGNGLVVPMKQNLDGNTRNVFINDFKMNYEAGKHTLTGGVLYFDTNASNNGAEQSYLLDVKSNASIVSIVGLDASGADVGIYNPDGGKMGSSFIVVGGSRTRSTSFYLNDEFQITDKLRIDAGIRHETINYMINTISFAGYNYAQERTFKEVAWTLGGNYLLGDKMAVYARYAKGHDFGVRAWDHWGTNINDINLAELNFSEVGFRYNGSIISGSITGFRSVNKNVDLATNDLNEKVHLDNVATGVEFESRFRFSDNFDINLGGVVMNSKITGGSGDDLTGVDIVGKKATRTPNVQIKMTPTLFFADRKGSAYANLNYVGDSYGDLENTLKFPGYLLVGAGLDYNILKDVRLGVQVLNLTNALGFTEGNPRGDTVSAGTSPYIFARAILPRTARFSLTFDF